MKSKPVLFLLAILLASCAYPTQSPAVAPATEAPVQASTSQPEAPLAVTAIPTPGFETQLFSDAQGRFHLDYPTSWQILGGESGARGSYVQILSWDPGPAGFEEVPAGESLLQIAEYQWDPKGDLAARMSMRRTAIESSGTQIVSEDHVTPANGPAGVRWLLLDSQGKESVLYLFVLGDSYLELAGIGDLQLLDQVISTFDYGA
ncbi:MAG: hypothetical protein KF828_04025 [Anaerolineales bacterium]|nr:hypothetical protein [Anaerolineales bacterium]